MPEDAKPFEKFEFGAVITREEQRVTFPGMDVKWYVTARAPDAQGAKRIEAAPLRFADSEAGGLEASANTYALYIAKCEAQVVDFCLPEIDEAGQLKGEVRFDHKFPGRNKAIYDALSPATVRYLEGALDHIGGRTTALAEEYEQLKNGCSPSANTG